MEVEMPRHLELWNLRDSIRDICYTSCALSLPLSVVNPILPYVTPETVKSSGCLRYRHLELSHKHFLLRFYKNKQKEKSVVGFGSITSGRGGGDDGGCRRRAITNLPISIRIIDGNFFTCFDAFADEDDSLFSEPYEAFELAVGCAGVVDKSCVVAGFPLPDLVDCTVGLADHDILVFHSWGRFFDVSEGFFFFFFR